MRKIVKLQALLLSCALLWGCTAVVGGIVGAGIGVGTYRYIEGSLERDYSLPFKSAWDATNLAFANLAISVTESSSNGVAGTVYAVRRDGVRVTARLRETDRNVTQISIRVGVFGDREKAERIHREIRSVAGVR